MALVFDDGFILRHKLASQFLSDLATLCRRDCKGKDFFHKQIVCLDTDAYETSLSGNNDATMDASVGIADYENNRMANSRHLLVELRFNYKSTRGFDVDNMRRKISHTKDLLKDDGIHPRFVFIYTDAVAPQARSYFNRLLKQSQNSDMAYWDARSVSEFDTYVVDKATLPYTPINDTKQIETELLNLYHTKGYEGLVCFLDHWINKMKLYELRYNREECESIAKVLNDTLKQVPEPQDAFNKSFIDLMVEDIKYYLPKKDLVD